MELLSLHMLNISWSSYLLFITIIFDICAVGSFYSLVNKSSLVEYYQDSSY